MLRVVLNTSLRQYFIKQQLCRHQPPISKTIQLRRKIHAEHCWRSKSKLISDVLLWTPSHRRARVGRLTRTYLQQLCTDTGCSMEDLPRTMDNWGKWWERVKEIYASLIPWWWWHRYNILPNNSATDVIEKNLNNLGIKTVTNSS